MAKTELYNSATAGSPGILTGYNTAIDTLASSASSDPDAFYRSARSTGTEAAIRMRDKLQNLKFAQLSRVLSPTHATDDDEAQRRLIVDEIDKQIARCESLIRLR